MEFLSCAPVGQLEVIFPFHVSVQLPKDVLTHLWWEG